MAQATFYQVHTRWGKKHHLREGSQPPWTGSERTVCGLAPSAIVNYPISKMAACEKCWAATVAGGRIVR